MFDPVWLGNYIVPRWEALLIVFGGGALAIVAAVWLLLLSAYGWSIILKRIGI